MTNFWFQHVIKGWFLLEQNFAVAILDANNRVWSGANPIVSERGIGAREIEGTHLCRSQCDGRIRWNIRTNTKLLRQLYHVRYRCKFQNGMDCCKIDRLFERIANGDRAALEFAREIMRMPRADGDR